MKNNAIFEILDAELVLALGCTEPSAVAYATSLACEQVASCFIDQIEVSASINIIKNVAAVTIPGTDGCGMDLAAALGAVSKRSSKKLEVLSELTAADHDQARKLIRQGRVTVEIADTPYKVYIAATVRTDKGEATVILAGHHTHVARLVVNGKILVDNFPSEGSNYITRLEQELTPDVIWDFSRNIQISKLEMIKQLIKVNTRLGQEGLKNPYGLAVGRSIINGIKDGFYVNDLCSYAMALTAAGSDARMAGCTLPAYANSGSGNQGIQSSLPIVAIAQRLNKDEESMIRAVALSCLITIYIKASFGRLSALCGATVAATGSSCGIVYLLGGNLAQVTFTIKNMLGNVTGMLCDGAKSGCALKIATCTSAAVQSAFLALQNITIQATDGIIEEKVENTVDNLGKLSRLSSTSADRVILDIILNKNM